MTLLLADFHRFQRMDAVAELLKCCGSRRWAEAMADARPFPGLGSVLQQGDDVWRALCADDWREAFAHHPRIGEANLRERFTATAEWASDEQKGTATASKGTLRALASANEAYERRFGHVFLIFASGKSADEMLAALRARLGNEPARELAIAAEEQRKITRLRLEKLFHE